VNDRHLVQLINTRVTIACELAKKKRELGLAMVDPAREQEVLAGVVQNNDGPLDDVAIQRIFERIIEETRRVQANQEPATF